MLEMIFYSLRLGIIGFGGPLALIALVQKECVHEKKWISEEEFLRALPLIKSMPGPVAWQTLIYVLRHRFGSLMALMGSILFILPSFLMMVLLAYFYQEYRSIHSIAAILDGMQVAAFLLIVFALKPLAQNYYRKKEFSFFLMASLVLFYLGLSEPLIILGMGLLSVLTFELRNKILSVAWPLFLVCFKAGALAFGTGLTIVPLLEGDFVNQFHWITHQEFMDALAFGQLTPGPVVITVTFIGFKLAGIGGATLATLGIFLPSTIHMLTWFPYFVTWMSKQRWIQEFLIGAVAALCAGILFVLFPIALAANKIQIVIFVLILVVQLRWSIASWKLILLAGALGAVKLLGFF